MTVHVEADSVGRSLPNPPALERQTTAVFFDMLPHLDVKWRG
ncbi:hypothetical protein ACIQPR_46960 [Streptomyces sp. NPDC091280]